MIPRYGKPPMRLRYRLRPGIYAILPRAGRLLLTHQADPEPEVQLPGGGIDPGEQPLPALAREVLEETGWVIARPRRFGSYRRFAYMPEYDLWAEKLCHVYVAHPVRRRGAPTENGHSAVWADIDVAAGLLASEGDRRMLAAALGQRPGRYSTMIPDTSSSIFVPPANR
ncbi:MAG: NUDIX hydrolase [Paracoccaceae bacterium]|nr:NUDIX hydrolase [Paracoccaceae bacterium]